MDRSSAGVGVRHAPTFDNIAALEPAQGGCMSLVSPRTDVAEPVHDIPTAVDRRPRFATRRVCEAHATEIAAEFSAAVGSLTTEQCLDHIRASDVRGASVTSLDEVHLDPQVVHDDTVVEHDADAVAAIRRSARRTASTTPDARPRERTSTRRAHR